MKRATMLCGAVAVSLWATAAFAQGRNFAGSWTVDSERTAAANAGAAGAAAGGMIVQRSADGSAGAVAVGAGGGGRGGGGGGAVMRTGSEVPTMAAAGGGGGARGGRGGPAGPTTIAIDANTFTVGATAYRLDGSATTTESPMGAVTSKATWKSDKLVIEITSPGANGPVVRTQTWYLEGDALVRQISTPSPDGGDPRVSTTYYKRS